MAFTVLVDDNFHYMDEDERETHGVFATFAEAEAVAREIVERSVRAQYRPGMSAEQLWDRYTDFGDDPFIRPEPPGRHFSAWDYAKGFSARLVAGQVEPGSRPAV